MKTLVRAVTMPDSLANRRTSNSVQYLFGPTQHHVCVPSKSQVAAVSATTDRMTSSGTFAGSAATGFVELSKSGMNAAKPKVAARTLSHEDPSETRYWTSWKKTA